ncbi:hypothetical protein SC65A3_02126 [Psychrobacter sp. SC65A.3]|uniref:RsiV family protein n=1 Tax=Psychrobacter sp. SC65A.3 TaxID=2983299 RepID=UPI0021D9FE4B|nr:RsiV family protein [Psychrobacter sp. SC65A.3]WAI88645.1 hypothetical protein SC65A3_02126 [Psychrobacter sp. SC65A.3]
MKTANQRPIIESQSVQQASTDAGRLRLLSIVSSALLFGTLSFSAYAGSLFSSTEYLDYQLPKKLQETCAARDNCPEIEVKYLKTNHKWLNDITNQRINTLVVNSKPSESAPITTKATPAAVKSALDSFAASQLNELPSDSAFAYSLTVTPEYVGHINDFETFEISSYVFTGGAHGMPYSEYLVFDQKTKKQIKLADMLQSGKKPQFKALAYNAYKDWVKTVDKDVKNYEKNWPFTLSDNVTLTDKGIDIRYQHYAIAPYAYGMPVLSIPYNKLSGIIQPRFIPK